RRHMNSTLFPYTTLFRSLNNKFDILQKNYQNKLNSALNDKHVILLFGGIVFVSCYFLFVSTPTELEPQEDQGFVLAIAQGDPAMTLDYLESYTREVDAIAEQLPEVQNLFLLNGIGGAGAATNSAFGGFVLSSWNERERNTMSVQQAIDRELSKVAGLQLFSFVPPSLPSAGGGPPVQFVIGSTESRSEEHTSELQSR